MPTAAVQMHMVACETGMTKHSAYSEVADSAVPALKIPTSVNLHRNLVSPAPTWNLHTRSSVLPQCLNYKHSVTIG